MELMVNSVQPDRSLPRALRTCNVGKAVWFIVSYYLDYVPNNEQKASPHFQSELESSQFITKASSWKSR
jgi:hypothetical protein